MICIFRNDSEQPIYKYEIKEGDKFLTVAQVQFNCDKAVVYRAQGEMIGFDLTNATEIFRSKSEEQFPNIVFDKPVTFKDGKVFLEDLEILSYGDLDKI